MGQRDKASQVLSHVPSRLPTFLRNADQTVWQTRELVTCTRLPYPTLPYHAIHTLPRRVTSQHISIHITSTTHSQPLKTPSILLLILVFSHLIPGYIQLSRIPLSYHPTILPSYPTNLLCPVISAPPSPLRRHMVYPPPPQYVCMCGITPSDAPIRYATLQRRDPPAPCMCLLACLLVLQGKSSKKRGTKKRGMEKHLVYPRANAI